MMMVVIVVSYTVRNNNELDKRCKNVVQSEIPQWNREIRARRVALLFDRIVFC